MVCNDTGTPGVTQATNNIADAAIRRHYRVVQAILHCAKLATKEMLFEAPKGVLALQWYRSHTLGRTVSSLRQGATGSSRECVTG